MEGSGQAYVKLPADGIRTLLRLGCFARIRTCHGGYLFCGNNEGDTAVGNHGTAPALNATVFWLQEHDKNCPQQTVMIPGPHQAHDSANMQKIKQGKPIFVALMGESLVASRNESFTPFRMAWAQEGKKQVLLQEAGKQEKRYLCAFKSGQLALKNHARSFERYELEVCAVYVCFPAAIMSSCPIPEI